MGHIAPATFGITLHQCPAREEPFVANRHGGGHLHELGIAWLGPVGEQRPQVRQWIAQRAHIPVENGDNGAGVVFIEHHIVELIVIVNQC